MFLNDKLNSYMNFSFHFFPKKNGLSKWEKIIILHFVNFSNHLKLKCNFRNFINISSIIHMQKEKKKAQKKKSIIEP
jgi:hypothetical protein